MCYFCPITAGMEKAPLAKSMDNQGRKVFEYDPLIGNFVSTNYSYRSNTIDNII